MGAPRVKIDEFIRRSKLLHGDKYDYSRVYYTRLLDKVEIICPNHGVIYQVAEHHMYGKGCKQCYLESRDTRIDVSDIKLPDGCKAVPLSQGKHAIVDRDDYDRVIKFKWNYSKGYAVTFIQNSALAMHRLIMDTPKGMVTDHINHDTLDNRKINLRICTNHQNQFNKRPNTKATSRYKGVSWSKSTNKWASVIGVDSGVIHLGTFDSEKDAARAYDVAAKKYHGEFAWLNFHEAQSRVLSRERCLLLGRKDV